MGPLWCHYGATVVGLKLGKGVLVSFPDPLASWQLLNLTRCKSAFPPIEGLRSIALDVGVEQINYYSITQLYNTKIV